MRRNEILNRIKAHQADLRQTYHVESLALFGSASRDELRADSDIDVLVSFDGPTTFRGYFGLKEYLESLLGRKVDLVSDKALRPELRPNIEKDLVHVS